MTSKDEGNDLFGRGEYDQALQKYSEAVTLCPMKHTRDRAIIYANRAACLMKMVKQIFQSKMNRFCFSCRKNMKQLFNRARNLLN